MSPVKIRWSDQTGKQPIYNDEFASGLPERESKRSHQSDTGYDYNTGKGHERYDESSEDSESNRSNDSRSNSSDTSDDNTHIWRTKPSQRRKRKSKRENKFLVLSDPFTSVSRFNSKTLTPPFKEWYNTEYQPVALQAGLSDRESCKRMRSYMDYAAKQAYDLAIGIHGFDLEQVCQYMHSKFKSSEKLTMAALHSRKMNSTETVTEYALQLQTMYGIIRPSASNKKRERELAPIFRHGIPKSLLDECNLYPYPKTLTETLEQVKHRETRWKEKQTAAHERNVNVRNVQTPIAYQATGNTNYWNQSRPRYNRSYSQPRQNYQVMNPWRNRSQGIGNQYYRNSSYQNNNPNVRNYWVSRQRRNSDPTGRRSQQCQICKRSNHTAATCYYRYHGRPEPSQGSAFSRNQPGIHRNGYGNPTYASVTQSGPYVAQAQACYQSGNQMGMQRSSSTNANVPIPGRVQPSTTNSMQQQGNAALQSTGVNQSQQ